MRTAIPIRLRREPLLEAVWEIRFSLDSPSSAGVLPGMLFPTLSPSYPEIVRLPVAEIPSFVVDSEAAFRYLPAHRFSGEQRVIQIGERMLSLSWHKQYPGWTVFSAEIRLILNALRETRLVSKLERYSLKYLNLIELGNRPSLECLNLSIRLGDETITTWPTLLRTETEQFGYSHIVQIYSPAEATLPREEQSRAGVLVDIDTLFDLGDEARWEEVESSLEQVHLAAKSMFFSLLTPETLEMLGPIYGEA